MGNADIQARRFIRVSIIICLLGLSCQAEDPSPKPWPEQFHAQLYQHTGSKSLAVTNLWYDWPNGRNFNIIQHQLSYKMYDVEWSNGTSYYFDLGAKTCRTLFFEVGILKPDWLLDHSHYLGEEDLNGFTCNVWEKEDFITYYEEKETQRPVGWLFSTGQFLHVITFEIGAVLGEANWQAPPVCFTSTSTADNIPGSAHLLLPSGGQEFWNEPWKRSLRAISGII